MKHLHNFGIVHRNLSPDNVIVQIAHNKKVVKIIDLKFAAKDNNEDFFPNAGTPGFMAPEIITKNPSKTSYKQDVFSLGVLFYSLLYGNYLFSGTNAKKLML